jgi:EpsI family protein
MSAAVSVGAMPPAMPLRRAALITLLLCAAVPAAEQWRPTRRTSEIKGAIDLKAQIPERFGDWQVDRSLIPILPDPRLQSTLDATYSQVLARTYIDNRGRRVMLSVAYGDDQSSEATAVHRPEFCYRGQGFSIDQLGEATLALPGNALRVQRLVGRLDHRFEPISYWITLDETATLPGIGRKLQQLRYGVGGFIADGMVVRVSTIGVEQDASFALQDGFIAQMSAALPAALRARYFGAGSAR